MKQFILLYNVHRNPYYESSFNKTGISSVLIYFQYELFFYLFITSVLVALFHFSFTVNLFHLLHYGNFAICVLIFISKCSFLVFLILNQLEFCYHVSEYFHSFYILSHTYFRYELLVIYFIVSIHLEMYINKYEELLFQNISKIK